ncbi:MAG: hypothetical protein R2697_15790 [Ilumatobacteraceae bacterium]
MVLVEVLAGASASRRLGCRFVTEHRQHPGQHGEDAVPVQSRKIGAANRRSIPVSRCAGVDRHHSRTIDLQIEQLVIGEHRRRRLGQKFGGTQVPVGVTFGEFVDGPVVPGA